MKAMSIATVCALAAGMAWGDPVEGVWQSPSNESGASLQVTISACGAAFCGTISEVSGGDASIVGKRMIWGMAPKGGGAYRGGKVWAPDDDKTYNGRLELSGNTLKISGCVLGICRGETFARK